jgi:type IV secretion system protein VirB3
MAAPLERDVVFTALTRPQMFAGVTYSFFVLNGVLTAEAFLITKSPWALLVALIVHAAGYVACLREPRIFDLWLTKVSRCPRVKNHALWGCNAYRP